ncbi:capsular polysaccharide export protein, LipB/KpsS family [Haloarcula halophila]|uniref:capsular polysaccharide export protein, LipB/KpsS family n=1 Tax=Haloarcula TaxID=2237 RepID=UPI0023E3982A|nr:hypothetical protein [Halomicroarcula sp. DFY41]
MNKRNLIRSLGIDKRGAELYYQFTPALPTDIREWLSNTEFDRIDAREADEVALFPIFHSHRYRTILFGLLAHALNYRGVGSVFVFGDGHFEACKGNLTDYEDKCVTCVKESEALTSAMNLPVVFLDEFDYEGDVSPDVRTGLEKYARATTIYQLQTAQLDSDDDAQMDLLSRFTDTASEAWNAVEALDAEYDFDYVVSTGSVYAPRGAAIEYASRNDIPITAFSDPANGTSGNEFLVGRMDGPRLQYLSGDAWEWLKSDPLSSEQVEQVDAYMTEKMETDRHLRFSNPDESIETDADTELYSMYTHLPWDAAIAGRSHPFSDQYEWVTETIRAFREFPERELVVKVHPGEKLYGTNESMSEIIDSRFDTLPDNVRVLPADTDVNPYTLIRASDVVLVFRSTVGMEATYLGVPVITASNGHYAHRGFTYDPETTERYVEYLESGRESLTVTDEMQSLLCRYLYNFVFERPIDFPFVTQEPRQGEWHLRDLHSIDQLKPEGNDVLDELCTAIIDNTSYFYTKTHETFQS